MKNVKTLKVLFRFITILMVASIVFGVMTENAKEIGTIDRLLAGIFGSFIVILLNYVIYKLLSKIWK